MLKKIIVATALFQVVSIACEGIPTKARNELSQIVYRLMVKDEVGGKVCNDKWISNKKYYDSVVKVIGKAIADCVTGINEFKDKKQGDVIWFEGTDPETYTQSNFNAVFLYNFIFAYMNYNAKTEDYDNFTDKIYNDILDFYKTSYKLGNISRFKTMLLKAKNDIEKYDDAICLLDKLFVFKEVNTSYNNYNYVTNIAPYIKVTHKLNDEQKKNAKQLKIKPSYDKRKLTDKLDFTINLECTIKYNDCDKVYYPMLTFVDNKWDIQQFSYCSYRIYWFNGSRIRTNNNPVTGVQKIKTIYQILEKDFCDVVTKIDKLLEGLINPIKYIEDEED